MSVVVDANFVIALRDPLDALHADASALNDELRSERLELHPVTLAECLVGPAHMGGLDAAESAIRASFEVLHVDTDAPARWAALRATHALRLPDVVVLDAAATRGCGLATFDERMMSVAGELEIPIAGTGT